MMTVAGVPVSSGMRRSQGSHELAGLAAELAPEDVDRRDATAYRVSAHRVSNVVS
jgi:hypothetical protein